MNIQFIQLGLTLVCPILNIQFIQLGLTLVCPILR